MLGEPWPTFAVTPWGDGDLHTPDITSIECTHDPGVLFMTDFSNSKVFFFQQFDYGGVHVV